MTDDSVLQRNINSLTSGEGSWQLSQGKMFCVLNQNQLQEDPFSQQYCIEDFPLTTVDHIRNLGVLIDS